jgi:cAMP-dependent protein kinase regulator
LTNQSVIDICAKFNDPLEACRAVVAESYELWLQYELRTDDITMICIFIDDVTSSLASSQTSSPDLKASAVSTSSVESIYLQDDELVCSNSRPVRKNISLEKSRALEKMKLKYGSCKDVSDELDEEVDLNKLYNEKTADEKARISEAIRASVIFQNITDEQRELIYGVMEPMHVKKGQWIIKQGTVGDRFYVVDDGSFEVRIVPDGREDVNNDGGDVVHVYTGARGRSHPSFGELALLHSAPRAASIIARTDGYLWALHRAAFKKVVDGNKEKKDATNVLKKIDRFKALSDDNLAELASYLCEAKYVCGDTIIKEGEAGDSIFVIHPGGVCGEY